MRDYRKERIGMKFNHVIHGEYEVVDYKNSKEVLVKFKSTGYITKCTFPDILLGNVKDPEAKSVFGVGIKGPGKISSNRKVHRSYLVWVNMLRRCYTDSRQSKDITYKGCSVCGEWLYYPNFKLWFDTHYQEGFQLDKDIKVKGNKLYSPDTCMLVPQVDNLLEAAKYRMYYSIVKNPCGKKFLVYNQGKFCRDNNLSQSAFNMVMTGKIKHTKGYTLVRRLSNEEAEELTKGDL